MWYSCKLRWRMEEIPYGELPLIMRNKHSLFCVVYLYNYTLRVARILQPDKYGPHFWEVLYPFTGRGSASSLLEAEKQCRDRYIQQLTSLGVSSNDR